VRQGFFSDPKYRGIAFFGLGLGCFLLAGLMIFFFSGRFYDRPSGFRAGPAPSVQAKDDIKAESPPLPREEQKDAGQKMWVVYITGAVASPGVYSIPPESRVIALTEAAGGLLPGADPVRVNLAAPLFDGAHIHVPLAGQEGGGGGTISNPQNGAFLNYSSPPAGDYRADRLIRVNSASQEELQRLPGVGPAIARAIIEQRARMGGFSSLGDLLKVKGIGPKKLEDMRFHVDLQ
jgi:competence protein ComEA